FGVQNTLTFTNGNITLNSGLFDVNTIVGGSASSKFISNGGGYIRTTAISAGPVMVPVAPDAASYNPVTIANGGGHSYRVSVKQGLNPAIAWPANAVNRTWSVTPLTTVAVPVTITLGYSDADGGSAFNPLGMMEAGVHNSNWILTTAAGGVAATGTSALRSVTTTTTGTNFGPMVVGNVGSILLVTAVPTIDADVTLLQLLPNVVAQNTVLRVAVRRTLQSQWVLTDAQGRVVRSFRQSLTVGTNDLRLSLGDLAAGTYFLQGSSSKGAIGTLRLVKQ
ncbi:MAG: T9SS type A sorting domain-containing protein, partial [Cytophagaceae bacterium]